MHSEEIRLIPGARRAVAGTGGIPDSKVVLVTQSETPPVISHYQNLLDACNCANAFVHTPEVA